LQEESAAATAATASSRASSGAGAAAAAPTVAAFAAEPTSIERGQSSTLSWNVTDATSTSIDNAIGTVQATGSRRVFPGSSTTYTLTAYRSRRH